MLLATGLGTGFLPVAPGTWGSALGLVVWWFAFSSVDPLIYVGIVAASALGGTYVLHWVCKRYALGDDSALVLDEVVGQWVTLLWVPDSLWAGVFAFFAFRAFDVVKPWPVSKADRDVKGGFGVMLDDLLAGLMACAVVHFALWSFAAG